MTVKYSDFDIAKFVAERKPLDKDFRKKIRLREKRGHKEQELDVIGDNGNLFRLILRQSNYNSMDFSVILAYSPPKSNRLFRLRRYNGKSHEHTNHIESDTFYDFHIHTATARYQEVGSCEDTYAESTKRFSDLDSAINCMIKDCAFDLPEDPQMKLFEGV